MNQSRLSQLALHFVPGVGHQAVKQLVSYAQSAENVFRLPKGKLLKIPGIGQVTATAILNKKYFDKAEETIKRAEKEKASILLHTDPAFPQRLNALNDAPSLLYYKGNADLNRPKIVAVVGTRNATPYGKEITTQLVKGLKKHDALVVSGLAYGIDIQAHRACITNELDNIGVMANGMNAIYPAVHRATAEKMVAQGGLLTEYPFDSPAEAPRFPARNRIIAGMADAVIVVEAAKKGGALITAEIANGYNKDVFAIPGSLTMPFSEGCNLLIRNNKAHLLTGVHDLEYIMGWEAVKNKEMGVPAFDLTLFEPEEQRVITALSNHEKPMLIDNLSWQAQLSVNQLASILLNLEMKGVVNSLPGKQYQLVV